VYGGGDPVVQQPGPVIPSILNNSKDEVISLPAPPIITSPHLEDLMCGKFISEATKEREDIGGSDGVAHYLGHLRPPDNRTIKMNNQLFQGNQAPS